MGSKMKQLRRSAPPEKIVTLEERGSELCDSCHVGRAVGYLSVDLAITDDESEEEAFFLCAGCSAIVRRHAEGCQLASGPRRFPPEDFTPTGCALLHLTELDDDDDDDGEQWVFCGDHVAELTERLHELPAEPGPDAN